MNRFNIASIDIDCQSESHRILSLYTRYMLRKFRFGKYNHSIFKICPNYDNYYFHLNGLLLMAKKNLSSKRSNLNYPPTCCKEIDLIAKRFLLRKYKIKVCYNSKIKLKNNIGNKNYRLRIYSFMRDVIFDLRPRGSNNSHNKKLFKLNNSQSNVLILSHDLLNSFEAYKNLPKKLTSFFKKKNMKTILILPSNIGLTIFEKINYLNLFLEKLFKSYTISFLKLSDYHFIISELYNQIYKKKLKSFFLRKKILFIVCSYIDSRYEPIYYEAAKELNIKYYTYDYSLGYPFGKIDSLRYLPDTRKFSDFIFANSNFRREQYKIATSFLDNPPIILPNICPQSDYSKNVEKLEKFNSKEFKIGIVDNAFNDDYAINYEDISSLIKVLTETDLEIKFILQSKRGFLEKEFIRLNSKNYSSGVKGNLSKLNKSDLIISIGWQSAALKAASLFKKPLIFYNKLDFPYEKNLFSLDKERNQIIKKYSKKLWLNEKNIFYKLSKIIKDKREFISLLNDSSILLSEIGFYEKKIEDYFNNYFKD